MNHFKMLIYVLIFSSFSIFAQETKETTKKEKKSKTVLDDNVDKTAAVGSKLNISDGTTTLLEFENEGTAGSIILPDVGASSTPAGDKLYNKNGNLYWKTNPLTTGGGSSPWTLGTGSIYYTGGDVGIGTSSLSSKLGIFHNSSLSNPHISLHENGNDYARVNFKNNNGSNYWTIAAYIASNSRNDRLNFWNGTSGDLLSLTGDGRLGLNVGISPKTTFHVGNGEKVLFGTDTIGNGDKLMFLPRFTCI